MATFYVGPRPVLRGVNTKDMVNPYTSMTGKAKGTGTYSYYPLYNTSHILTGAPDNNHVPGTGYFPGDVFMSQVFRGSVLYIHPLSGQFANGIGTRFKPLEFKGLTGAVAFPSAFGHELRYNEYRYNNNIFDGVPSTDAFANTGHAYGRTEAQGAPATFGFFIPDSFAGVDSAQAFPTSFGQGIPAGYNNAYGKNRVQEWRGVASSQAL